MCKIALPWETPFEGPTPMIVYDLKTKHWRLSQQKVARIIAAVREQKSSQVPKCKIAISIFKTNLFPPRHYHIGN